MKTIGVRQGMSIMDSGVMDTVFHSGDAWDSVPYKLSVELSAVLRSDGTKYCPMLSVSDLLVTFH